VQCHEEIPFSSLQAFQVEVERYPDLGGIYENGLFGGPSYQVCSEWGAGKAEDSANQPVYSDIPTLLMSGEFDPITPPEWGRHAAETLENGYFYEYPGIGHGASALPGCPSQMFMAFLENPAFTPDGACIQEMSN
jgi:pimeloyl-ACP methyl ester carboxylesterase